MIQADNGEKKNPYKNNIKLSAHSGTVGQMSDWRDEPELQSERSGITDYIRGGEKKPI